MRPKDRLRGSQLDDALVNFDRDVRPLRGIKSKNNRQAFIEQILESIHRVRYISVISQRDISPQRGDPDTHLFDPLKAALLHQRAGRHDEAFWLVFLSVHFGKHGRDGWRLTRDVYGRLGGNQRWDWANASVDPVSFRRWITQYRGRLTGKFGNHRKYASLADTPTGTGAVIESYVRWVAPPKSHQMLINETQTKVGIDPRAMFDDLYVSLDDVVYFGRMAKFDFLTMIGKLQLAAIEPGSLYMDGATGPFSGACLLFAGTKDFHILRPTLDAWCVELADHLGIGMQELEDSLCNWQKSPEVFKPFRG